MPLVSDEITFNGLSTPLRAILARERGDDYRPVSFVLPFPERLLIIAARRYFDMRQGWLPSLARLAALMSDAKALPYQRPADRGYHASRTVFAAWPAVFRAAG